MNSEAFYSAFQAGKHAFATNADAGANPHERGSEEWVAWSDGYVVAMQAVDPQTPPKREPATPE